MSFSGFRTNANKKSHPIHEPKGVTESELAGYSLRKGVTAPERRFSKATPSSELAQAKTQMGHLRSLNKRLELLTDKEKRDEEKASKTARKSESARIKEERRKEADKNLELASEFFNYAKSIQKGKNPEPVNVTVNIDDKKTLPKSVSKDEKVKEAQEKVAEEKKEEKVIEKINSQSKPAQPSPAMPAATKPSPQSTGLGFSDVKPTSPHTEEAYAYAASPAYTTKGEQPKKSRMPIQKTNLSLSEIALERYPAKG